MNYTDKLKLAKEALESGSYDRETIEYIFPKLKENDDEKIRKEIIEAFNKFSNNHTSLLYSPNDFIRWTIWLERQGGQNPNKTTKEAWKEMRLEVYAQASGNRHELNYSDDNSKMFSLNDIDEIFEKISNSYVEQKSVEWSEEDELNMSEIQRILKLQGSFTSYLVDWLKSLRPQKQWKPSE